LIVAQQINWTEDCAKALHAIASSEKPDKNKAWKSVKDEKTHFLGELTR
jgi:hypothetical protein